MDSPPLSFSERKCSINSVDLDSYFATYVPLSNLPTPPLSGLSPAVDRHGGAAASIASDAHKSTSKTAGGSIWRTEQTAPATYLASLVPSNACVHLPSVPAIEAYLSRSRLPLETVALGACILDTLSSRFARNWRKALESSAPRHQSSDESVSSSKSLNDLTPTLPAENFQFTLFSASSNTSRPSPNLIVLAALSLASSWTNDAPPSAKAWCQKVANGDFEAKQLNATTRCMLKDIDYALNSFTCDVIEEMVEDLELFRSSMEDSDAQADEDDKELEEESSENAPSIPEIQVEESVSTNVVVRTRSDTLTSTICELKELRLDTTRETIFVDGFPTPDLSPPA